jgi:hypothetical protein
MNANQNTAIEIASLIVAPKLELTDIVAERKAWEIGAYRTSNQQLYAVLAKSLTFFIDLNACTSKKDAMRESFDKFVASNDIKFKKDTSLINKVVKCVFYDEASDRNAQRDRRRISAYSMVLRRAQEDSIKPVALAAWIEKLGGIEEIRLNKPNAMSATEKAVQARTEVEESNDYIAKVTNEALMKEFDSSDYDKAFVAVIVPRGNGTVEIRNVVKGAGAVNAALASIYTAPVESDGVIAVNSKELQAA